MGIFAVSIFPSAAPVGLLEPRTLRFVVCPEAIEFQSFGTVRPDGLCVVILEFEDAG